jgi:hypothetical protein
VPTRKQDGDQDEGAKVVPIRKGPPSRKGIPATEKQKEALARGHKANQRRKEERESEEDGPTRWELYLKGDLPVSDWDDQELARMQTRNFHGQFAGRLPTLRPSQIREIKGELLRRGERDFSKYGILAIKTIARIMVSDTERAADRLRAANIFLERCYGKVPETVKVAVAEAWQDDIDAVMSVMDDEDEETA